MFRNLRLKVLSCAITMCVLGGSAQDCSIPFTEALFNVQEEHDIYFGSATAFNGSSVDLYLNLFKPIGDEQVERPLVIVVHGGGFFQGHRNDRNAICHQLASMGWAAATVSYRLDFYGTWLLPSPFAYDPAEVVRAAYRAQQDVRGAVRFLKARHLQDSTSTEKVLLWGYSAGAISALHAALVDDPSEKPPQCEAIGDVSHFLNFYQRPDLGPIEGTLNLNNGYDESVIGLVSNYGGLLDTALLSDPLDPALYLYHQSGDPIVGCGHQQGLWNMPLGVGDNYPWLYGSCVMDAHIQTFGPDSSRYRYHEFNGNEHDIHNVPLITAESVAFLKELVCPSGVRVAARVLLEGPYAGNGEMNDALRTLTDFPLQDPYPVLGYQHVGASNDLPIEPTLLTISGPDAVVDWVILELRDPSAPEQVIASRSVLLQRDGDIVDLDGLSAVDFDLEPGVYHLAVRHRNHLGAMTAQPIQLISGSTMVDFSSSALATYGLEATKAAGAYQLLWAGDVNFDQGIQYTGGNNDRDLILARIGGMVPTNSIDGYFSEDVNLDGTVKYTGGSNDRDIILQSIGGTVPTNVRYSTIPQ